MSVRLAHLWRAFPDGTIKDDGGYVVAVCVGHEARAAADAIVSAIRWQHDLCMAIRPIIAKAEGGAL
jgi:hypothetical protein